VSPVKIPGVAKPTAADRAAAIRYGPSVRRIAQRYRNPYTGKRLSGAALLLKLASGESSFNSSANSGKAQGRTQFTPASRRVAIQKYGVDPLSSIDAAYHAAALHLRGKINGSKGLEGYNPGDPSYTSYILGQKVGKIRGAPGSGGARGAGGGAGGVSGTPGTLGSVGAQNLPMGSTGALDALAALAQQPASPPPSALPAPSFAAAPALPQGYQPVQSGGGPEPKVDVDSLLEQIRTPGGDVQLAPGVPGTAGTPGSDAVTGGIGSSPTGKGRGRVVVAPGADRPGARTRGDILNFAREVSGIAGQTLRIGTGTRHSRLTINGTVSDHWRGEGVDIPKTGRGLVHIGQAALIAAGMDPKKARKQTGGGFNVGDWQIIFNTNAKGWGDHTTHLHIGRRR
jgi:hypothetical protein